jgi:shikimate kinase
MGTSTERPIALIGLMGAGKSTVARLLGERLAVAVADLDAMLEAEEGCTILELFDREGEPYLRRRERDLLARTLQAGARVLACGGGVIVDEGSRALLQSRCRVVWLEVSPAEAERRVRGSAATRPLLRGAEGAQARLEALLAQRAALYAGAAELRVPTDGRTPQQVADTVADSLARVA